MSMEFVDRYSALGIPYPDPETVCTGQCEGVGWVPVYMTPVGPFDPTRVYSKVEDDPKLQALWGEAHAKPHDEPCDGWHFVKCPDCNGTGRKAT